MSSSAFKAAAAAAAAKGTKNMDKFLTGSGGKYLDEGTHDVTITSVGPSLDQDGSEVDGKLAVTYATDDGKVYNERGMFLTNTDGTELSLNVRMLLSAVIPDTDLMDKFLDIAVTDDHAFEMFTGMKLRITLKPGPGTQARADALGKFASWNVDKKQGINEKVTDDYDSIKDARDAAKAAGYKVAYNRISGTTCTHGEANAAAFNTALSGRNKPKSGVVKVTKAV